MMRLCVIVALLAVAHALPQQSKTSNYEVRSLASGRGRHGPGRVIGGQPAERGQFPFAAFVISEGFACGGSLISQRYVLTIAQCVDGLSYWEVYLGAADLSAVEPGRTVVTTVVAHKHPGYNVELSQLTNDIAIVDLSVEVPLSSYVQAAKLPAYSQVGKVFLGQTGIFTAWGGTNALTDTALSYSLNYAQLAVIDDGDEGWAMHAQGENGETGCDDYGSPLVQTGENQSATVIGVNSFVAGANGCIDAVSGFTIVSLYLDWISYVTDIQIRQIPA